MPSLRQVALSLTLTLMLAACGGGGDSGGGGTNPEPVDPVPVYPAPPAAASWWKPARGVSFQIQFDGTIDTNVNAEVYDLDLYDTDAATIANLKAKGRRLLCYINVGAWENWRSDKDAFPAAVLGKNYAGWAGEKWLDIRQYATLAPIMRARMDLCKSKGFDGIDPDNLDNYLQDTGFPITQTDQLAYNRWIAREAHARGLAVGQKNVQALTAQLQGYYDFAIVEQCVKQGWCSDMNAYLRSNRPVFALEYVEEGQTPEKVCPTAQSLGLTAVIKRLELGAFRQGC